LVVHDQQSIEVKTKHEKKQRRCMM
jgi:hypothetical protein